MNVKMITTFFLADFKPGKAETRRATAPPQKAKL